MSAILEKPQSRFNSHFSTWLEQYLLECRKNSYHFPKLLESQGYSLLSGGKRFRPFLAFLFGEMLNIPIEKLRSHCLSLELVHTYSLIHDDLPCMDNDDFRRGKLTNHKVYGESLALLAGDGLLSDVFYLLSSDHNLSFETRTKLISMLSLQIGSFGMVSGQAQDMAADANLTFEKLKTIHNLKTANLIEAAAVGAAIIAHSHDELAKLVMEYAHCLGMAFQIKDDILDENSETEKHKSFVGLLGRENALAELEIYNRRALQALENIHSGERDTASLKELLKVNFERAE